MSFGALFSALSGLQSQSSTISMIADNISNTSTVGYKRRDQDFKTIVTNGNSSTSYASGGAQVVTRRMVDRQGIPQATGNSTDIALDGPGMFVVNTETTGTGEFVYSRAGSYRQNEKGTFIDASGNALMAWELDNEGRLPGEAGNLNTVSNALLSSTKPVNFRSISGTAVATTKVEIGITLDASSPFLKGAGEIIEFPKGSASLNNNISGDELIVPNTLGIGRIQFGDTIAIKPTPPGAEVQFKYGGIAVSNDISGGILGSTATNSNFVGATNDHGFRIVTTNNINVVFRYRATGSVNASKGEFSTLEDLSAAINAVPGLKSKIVNGRLYIGTILGTSGIDFSNLATTDFVGGLGLTNIAAENNRFSTINSLRTIMSQAEGLEAIDSGTGGIDFYTELPTAQFKIHGISARNVVNAADVTNATTQAERRINITSAAHGLAVGDYVRVEGYQGANGATLPDGVYMVTDTPDANHFVLNSPTSATAIGSGIAANTSFTWTKAPGQIYTQQNLVTPNVTTTVGPDTVTVADAAHTLVVGDVIYISGYDAPGGIASEVPDGYYRITAVNPGVDFTFTPKAVTAAGAAPLNANLTYQKVGTGTPTAINTTAVTTFNGSRTVRVHMPNHGMQLNNIFTFKNIGGITPLNIDGIQFDNDSTFSVTNIGADYFEFEAETEAITGGIINAGLEGITINEYTRLFNEMNLTTDKFVYGPAYNSSGGNAGKNLSEGLLTSGVYSRPLTIYDSLGVAHDFRVSFAKLQHNLWAVEIHAVKKSDGTFDIITPRTDGQIAAGTITFNGDGTLANVSPASLLSAIPIRWINQALDSNIKIDWGNAGVPQGTPGATTFGESNGMRQVASVNGVRFMDQNGVAPGLLKGVSIDPEGYMIASFTNGSQKRIFRLPVAQFTNYNGLAENSGNTYSETFSSGSFNLRPAGSGGVAKVIPEALEKSNADLSEELTKLIISQKSYQANAKVITVNKELLETLDRSI